MRKRDRIAAALVAGTMATAVLAVGSVLRWGVLLSTVLCIACAVPYLRSKRSIISHPPLLMLLLLAFGFTLLQVIPLPAAVVKLLSPHKYTLTTANAKALGSGAPAWIPLSYDPAATLLEVAKFAGYIVFAFACLRLAAQRRGRVILCTTVASLGIVVSLIAHLHTLLHATKLYGVYTPTFKPIFLAPLLNANHLAGFLAMTTPVCLALAVTNRGPARLVWSGGVVLCAGTALLTESRGGAGALALGLFVATALLLVQRRRGTRDASTPVPLSVLAPAAIVTLCISVLLVALTAGGVAKEFAKTGREDVEHGKLSLWTHSVPLLKANPWTGVGRGGFEAAYARYNPEWLKSYSHVENEYLQAPIDWGIPAAGMMALALIYLMVAAARRWQSGPLVAAALGGVTAIITQNTLDFNLRFPSVALAAIALVCVIVPPALSKAGSSRHSWVCRGRTPAVAVAALAWLVALTPLTTTAHSAAESLRAGLAKKDADMSALVARAKTAMGRHPSDYVIAGLTAQAMFRLPDQRQTAFAVIRRALALNPLHAGLNQVAARMLLNATPPRSDEALIQYAVALRHVVSPAPILLELMGLFPDPQVAARGLPLDPKRGLVLQGHLLQLKSPEVALAYARRLNKNFPDDPDVLGMIGAAALAQGKASEGIDAARRAYKLRPTADAALLQARLELETKQSAKAAEVLAAATAVARHRGATRDVFRLQFQQLRVLYDQEKYKDAKLLAAELLNIAANAKDRGRVHMMLSNVEVKLGNLHQAVFERNRALRLLGIESKN